MSDARTTLAACVLVLLAAALPVAVSSLGTAATTSISAGESPTADPDGTIATAPGENVRVVVWANATNVTAYQANLTFDPDVVQVVDVSGSSAFEDPVANADDGGGWVAFNQLRPSETADPVLAAITFEVADGASGTSNVSFAESDVKFATENGETSSPGEYRGVTLQIEDSTATPTPTKTPTSTPTATPTPTPTATPTGPGPIGDFENPPTDPDGDGKYEDVNGDGDVNVGDAQALFANTDDPVVQDNTDAFDFNDDGSVNVGDAQAIFANGVAA